MFDCASYEVKSISDYTSLNFNDVLNLPLSLYLLYRKEAWIEKHMKTESGREFLKDVWRLQQTKADLNAVRDAKVGGDS